MNLSFKNLAKKNILFLIFWFVLHSGQLGRESREETIMWLKLTLLGEVVFIVTILVMIKIKKYLDS